MAGKGGGNSRWRVPGHDGARLPPGVNDAVDEDRFGSSRKTCEDLYLKYVGLFDFAPIGYLVIDADDMIHELNLSVTIALNAPRSKLVGRWLTDFIHHDDLGTFGRQKRCCRQRSETSRFELKMKKTDGFLFDAELQMQVLPSHTRDASRYSVALADISEQVQLSSSVALQRDCLEIASRANTQKALLDGFVTVVKAYLGCAAVGIRIRDAAGNIPYLAYDGFNRAFHRSENRLSLQTDHCLCTAVIKGDAVTREAFMTPKGAIYINATSRFLEDSQSTALGPLRNACQDHGFESIALVPIRIDQTVAGLIHAADTRKNHFPLRMVESLEYAASRLGLALQRFQLEARLRESVDTLNDLSSHLLTVQEDEQRRIAMELHDGCGQDLNVLKLRLQGLKQQLRSEAPGRIGQCDDMLAFMDKIINDIRGIAHNLNPATIEALGLTAATRQMISEFSGWSGIPAKVAVDPLEHVQDLMAQVCLFRIFQEALLNVHKHARAACLWVSARVAGELLRIEIRDNGIGFEVSGTSPKTHASKGMGLSAVELRCRMIGAQLSIVSRKGKGTRLVVRLPLSNEGTNR